MPSRSGLPASPGLVLIGSPPLSISSMLGGS
jgi:hypothetical protein